MVDSHSETTATTPADARCVGSHSSAEGSHVATDHMLGPLKLQMGGRRFSNSEEVAMAIRDCLRTLGPDFYGDGNFNSHQMGKSASACSGIILKNNNSEE